MGEIKRTIRNCPVAVVGGAGFIGSHLVDYLIEERNCTVVVIDNLISGTLEFLNKKAIFEYGDITGSESYLFNIFKHYNIKFVFNYAAEPYIPVSFARPLHVFNINAFGALKVINAAYEAGCEGILQVSSAEIYGDAVGKVDELFPVRPHSTYGVAKAAIDYMVQARWKEAKTPVLSLRQFNVVGERDILHPYIIPEIITQIHNGSDVVRLGNNSFRDFQYVKDAVVMATELLEYGDFGEVYNMGSEEGIQMYDLARRIGVLMGKKVHVEKEASRVRPWEIWHLQSDNTKLYSKIPSRPQFTLDQALQNTILWIQNHINSSKPSMHNSWVQNMRFHATQEHPHST